MRSTSPYIVHYQNESGNVKKCAPRWYLHPGAGTGLRVFINMLISFIVSTVVYFGGAELEHFRAASTAYFFVSFLIVVFDRALLTQAYDIENLIGNEGEKTDSFVLPIMKKGLNKLLDFIIVLNVLFFVLVLGFSIYALFFSERIEHSGTELYLIAAFFVSSLLVLFNSIDIIKTKKTLGKLDEANIKVTKVILRSQPK